MARPSARSRSFRLREREWQGRDSRIHVLRTPLVSCAHLLPKFCKRLFASANGSARISPKRSLQTKFGEDFHGIGPRIPGITNRFEQRDQRNFPVARQIAIAERARCAPIANVHTKNTAVQLG